MTRHAAAVEIPSIVTVSGTGSIRVLLAAGTTIPCDSTSNVPIFDGWLDAGRTYTFVSPQLHVCERHTHGVMRTGDWTRDRLWHVPYPGPKGAVLAPLRIDIFLSTD